MPDTGFIQARNRNGEIQRIPRDWLTNPAFAGQFTVTPSQRETDPEAARLDGGPSESWTRAELDDYAAGVGVDHPDRLPNKAAVLDAITNPDPDADADGGDFSQQTPPPDGEDTPGQDGDGDNPNPESEED